jgi:hypothetical protein
MKEILTRLQVTMGVAAPKPFVVVTCSNCNKNLCWPEKTILPNYCPYCGGRNVSGIPFKR